jgi:hypothetical protein
MAHVWPWSWVYGSLRSWTWRVDCVTGFGLTVGCGLAVGFGFATGFDFGFATGDGVDPGMIFVIDDHLSGSGISMNIDTDTILCIEMPKLDR